MTSKEFQLGYHKYSASTQEEADVECKKVNEIGVDDNKIVVACFGGVYCLMLETAFDAVKEMDIG